GGTVACLPGRFARRDGYPWLRAPSRADREVQQFDGRMLSAWLYNGQVPGPVLRVRLGEAVEVRLKSDLPQPTTIHSHGVRVANVMDRVPGVTTGSPGESTR